MENNRMNFIIHNGSSSYQKWKGKNIGMTQEEKLQIKEGPRERSEKNREKATQFQMIFEPYLQEILEQFPRAKAKY